MKTLLELNKISNMLRVDEKKGIEMYMQLNSIDKKFYVDHIEDSELKYKFWDAIDKYEIHSVAFLKTSALRLTKQYVRDNKQYIDGNVAEYLVLNVQNSDQGYLYYLNDEAVVEYENADSERRAEIKNKIENWINDNFNFDIEEFE